MQFKDYYETLGVSRGADAEEVKRAYRKQARKYHPDVSKEKNAEEKFKNVQEAYEVLKDADKRAAYDQLGRDYRSGQQFRPPPDWEQRFGQSGGGHRFSDLNGFSDFFSSLFGAAGGGAAGGGAAGDWTAHDEAGESSRFAVHFAGREVAVVEWTLLGKHNVLNALAAIAAAHHVGIEPKRSAQALAEFRGVKRRMEIRGAVGGVTVYDDFAHHPTAIETTLAGLRARVGRTARIVAVLEPRSNTMKLGVHREQLAPSLNLADRAWFLNSSDLGWDLPGAVRQLGARARFAETVDALVKGLADDAQSGDHVLVMSNGGFGGLHDKLLAELRARGGAA
jgi:hypothetical protein